jgi:hypothetical protein
MNVHLIEITKWKGNRSYTKVRWLFYFDTCFQFFCLGNHATVSIDQLEATVKNHKMYASRRLSFNESVTTQRQVAETDNKIATRELRVAPESVPNKASE